MAQNSLSNFSRELPKEHSCEIISNLSFHLAEEVVSSFFSIYSLSAILFNGAEPFEQFW